MEGLSILLLVKVLGNRYFWKLSYLAINTPCIIWVSFPLCYFWKRTHGRYQLLHQLF